MSEQPIEPMKFLDYDMAVNLMEKAIGERGEDYIYEPIRQRELPGGDAEVVACLYFAEGEPSCLVGHVLSYMGYDSAPEGNVASPTLADGMGIDIDVDTADLLDTVQQGQDKGMPWGRALTEALAIVENLRRERAAKEADNQ